MSIAEWQVLVAGLCAVDRAKLLTALTMSDDFDRDTRIAAPMARILLKKANTNGKKILVRTAA